MNCTRLSNPALLSKQSATALLKTINGSALGANAPKLACVGLHAQSIASRRDFSSSQRTQLKMFFPKPNAPNIKITKAAWAHPDYSEDQMKTVTVDHRQPRDFPDRVAFAMVRVMRFGLDIATGYSHDKMTERKYTIRNVFLESVAGVPGMVAGMLRHLNSMRRMKRDNGWIETLLEESYNERMHLLIFLQMAKPGWFMRLMVLGAQGVFFNAMFFSYLISPRTCHRFVGYLEEEAVLTYTREIEDLDAGKLPHWAKTQAPEIAVNYYQMPEGKRSMRDLLFYIRADESKHREVNHTLGNLKQDEDPNPYASEYKDDKPHPRKDLKWQKPQGWDRENCI
nr:hypothetical protein B0A51_18233 [Rachicladosporium sp. CCFEE 5018]